MWSPIGSVLAPLLQPRQDWPSLGPLGSSMPCLHFSLGLSLSLSRCLSNDCLCNSDFEYFSLVRCFVDVWEVSKNTVAESISRVIDSENKDITQKVCFWGVECGEGQRNLQSVRISPMANNHVREAFTKAKHTNYNDWNIAFFSSDNSVLVEPVLSEGNWLAFSPAPAATSSRNLAALCFMALRQGPQGDTGL